MSLNPYVYTAQAYEEPLIQSYHSQKQAYKRRYTNPEALQRIRFRESSGTLSKEQRNDYIFLSKSAQLTQLPKDSWFLSKAVGQRHHRPIQDEQIDYISGLLVDESEHIEEDPVVEEIDHVFETFDRNTSIGMVVQECSRFVPEMRKKKLRKQLFNTLKNEIVRLAQLNKTTYYWAMRFQTAQLIPDDHPLKNITLTRLADDFRTYSIQYSRTIILELSLPSYLKSIRSVAIGGVAGGRKYMTWWAEHEFTDPYSVRYSSSSRKMLI